MTHKAQKHIKNIYINTLRAIFQTSNAKIKTSDGHIIADYTWTDQKATTKIDVYRALPEDIPMIPIILVTATTGDAPVYTYFGDTIANDKTTEETEIVGGKFNFNIDIKVIAETSVDRDNIVDIITTNIIYLNRSILAETYDLTVSDLTFSAETQEDYGAHFKHTQSIGFSVYSEWEETLDLTSLVTLNRIDLTVTPDETI